MKTLKPLLSTTPDSYRDAHSKPCAERSRSILLAPTIKRVEFILSLPKRLCFIVAFLLFTFLPTQTKAQDDANCRLLVDGTLTDKVDCYSFSDMSVVFPLKDVQKFDKYEIVLSMFVWGTTKSFSYESFWNTYGGGTLGAFNVYKNRSDEPCFVMDWGDLRKSRLVIMDQREVKDVGTERKLNFELIGKMITGYKEVFNNNTNSIVKVPTYGEAVNIYTKTFRFPDAIPAKFGLVSAEPKEGYSQIDYAKTCPVSGDKVNYKIEFIKSEHSPCTGIIKNVNVSSSSSSNNTTTEVKTTTSTKTETKTNTTTAKVSTASAISSTALKPLDKTKPGYFAEKNGNIITREGYKKGSALNGEVRDYNDDGKIRSIYTYVNDEKNGYSATFFDNGKIELTGNYKNGEKDGEWKEYNSDGKLLNTKKYVNGEVQD